MPPTDPEFHDPALKDAVCRCWACDCAPKELRNKIAGLLGKSVDQSVDHRYSLGWANWIIWPVAIAASLLFAVGLFHRFENRADSIVYALPATLEHDLIARHDRCSKMPDHQRLKIPNTGDMATSDPAITDALHTLLNQPVLVFHPQDPSWKFRGAAICGVGKDATKSGHLVFVKGSDALSIFSLPESIFPSAREGTQYTMISSDHCIVAFAKDGALFCIVGSGPPGDVKLSDLKEMETQMQPAVARLNASQPDPVFLTELLHPADH